jgi:hypothetical protein
MRRTGRYSYADIARQMEVSETFVRKKLKGIGNVDMGLLISTKKRIEHVSRYEKLKVDEARLRAEMPIRRLYGTAKVMGIPVAALRYWCERFGITIIHKSVSKYTHCQICGKVHPEGQKKGKHCNTCISKIRRLGHKMKAVRHKGGKCERCGFIADATNYAAFEFHHAGVKDIEIGGILNRGWKLILSEIDKCTLLCSNCHRITHSDYDNPLYLEAAKTFIVI